MTGTALNILKIDSSGRSEGSVSRQLTSRLADRLMAGHPGARVTSRDAAAGLPAINEEWIGANFTPADERSAAQKAQLEFSDELVSELRAADVVLIGLPIYNFGIPAALKAWIDLICRAGETFRYTKAGPEGLLSGKRAIVAVASGGVPVGSPADHATGHLAQVLNFVGITDITFVPATGLAMDPETPVQNAIAQIDALELKQAA